MTTDPDHKFDLALSLDDLDTALEIARTVPDNEADVKWKALGDRALAVWRFDLARECFEKANDLSALMLLLLSVGDKEGLNDLAEKAGTFSLNSSFGDSFKITVCSGERSKQSRICCHAPTGRRCLLCGSSSENAAGA